jgi:hypothetical protein
LSLDSFQLERSTQECDDAIRDFLLELGRRHFGYGAMPRHMELLVRIASSSFSSFADRPRWR